jgi:N-acetylglucosamine kinase-like BadF-type ATPase
MNVLGADVGGTSARVVHYQDGQERGRAEGPGGAMRLGQGHTLATALADLARPLLIRAGVVRADAFVVGASGAGREAERTELQSALEAQRLAWQVIVTTDAELARAAAFAGNPGVLLIAGTGSIAIVRNRDGSTRRVGGLGWRMGDQGSAHWLGVQGLIAVGAMHDHLGPPTRLTEALCAKAGVSGIGGLVRWSTTASPAEVAALGPSVVATAESGDAVAEGIVAAGVEWLVRLAESAGAGELSVALSGGLLATGRPLRERVCDALVARGIKMELHPIDPCRGAPVLARGS